MADHIKPTKKELAENALRLAQEAEQLPDETPEEETTQEPEVAAESIPSKADETAPSTAPIPELEEEEEPVKPVVDYKQKYRDSTREAQVLYSKDKKMNEAIDEASRLDNLPEEEMNSLYPDWDILSDFEKKVARDNEINKRRFDILHKASSAGKDIAAWNEEVDKFIEDPKILANNPDLEGRQDDFRIFATKPTRKNAPLEDLVNSFLFEVDKEEASKPKSKGEMFPTGTGGPSTPDSSKPKKLTVEEGKALRISNYETYKKKLRAGEIETENIE